MRVDLKCRVVYKIILKVKMVIDLSLQILTIVDVFKNVEFDGKMFVP